MKNINKSGGVLVMVMVVMLVFTVLAIGLFKLHQTDVVEAVYVEQSNQAFWIAESGMQRALDRLRTDKIFRDNPYAWYEIIGNGSNDVQVTKDTTTNNIWSIESQGTVGGMTRIVFLNPLLKAEVGYALMGLGGDSTLNNRGEIDGNVYNYGELWVNGRSAPSIDGEVLALDSNNLDYDPITGNDKIELEIQTSEWDFSQAGTAPTYVTFTTNVVEGGVTNTYTYKYLDLTSNKTVKVSGDYDLPNDVDGTIGDGTLIVDGGNLKFPTVLGTPYTVGAGATIMVGGDFTAKKEGTFEDNVTIYVGGNMALSKTGTGSTTSFFVEGDLGVDIDLTFNGLIFVDGFVQVDGDLTLEGSLIAGEGFWLKKDYDINYNPDYIDQALLDRMILYVVYATSPGTWDERPSS